MEPKIEFLERDLPGRGHQKAAFSNAGKVEVNTCNVFDNPPGREFETCIFNLKEDGGELVRAPGSKVVETYPSWEKALEGHKLWCLFFESNPDKGVEDVVEKGECPSALILRMLNGELDIEEARKIVLGSTDK